MPVVTDQGLVGRISDVTENTSKVLLLNDPGSSASALLADSRLNGIVRGSTCGDLIMDFIPQGPTFQEGEVVLSSGLGGKFPKGLAIGTIETIDSQPNAVFQTATVKPAVDFGSLELVLVITNFEPNESLPDFLAAPPCPGDTGGGMTKRRLTTSARRRRRHEPGTPLLFHDPAAAFALPVAVDGGGAAQDRAASSRTWCC